MRVVGMKLSSDPHSTKVLYEKHDNLYIRSGVDGFREGKKITAPKSAMYSKWGFRKTATPINVVDAEEMKELAETSTPTSDGTIRSSKFNS